MLCKSALAVQIALKRYGLDALLPLIERYIKNESVPNVEKSGSAEPNGVRSTGRAGQLRCHVTRLRATFVQTGTKFATGPCL
jgi:hypothetical protein